MRLGLAVVERNNKGEVVNVIPKSMDPEQLLVYEPIESQDLLEYIDQKKKQMGENNLKVCFMRLEEKEVKNIIKKRANRSFNQKIEPFWNDAREEWEICLKLLIVDKEMFKKAIVWGLAKIKVIENRIPWYRKLEKFLLGEKQVVNSLFKKYF